MNLLIIEIKGFKVLYILNSKEQTMTTFTENITKFEELIKKLEIDFKTVKSLAKDIKKNYTTDTKKKSTKKTESSGTKKNHGITEAKVLPTNVNEFIKYALTNNKLSEDFINNNNDIFENFSTETLVARTKVNSIIHNYIKTNKLYVDEDKRSIFDPDDKLKELFEIKDKEELNLRNIQTFLKRAYDKLKPDEKLEDKKQTKKNISKKDKKEKETTEEEEETENDSDSE